MGPLYLSKDLVDAKLNIVLPDLIKDGLVGTDETPLQHLLLPIRIGHGVADMEQLTVIGNICIVTIGTTIAGELVHNVLSDGVGVSHQAQGGRDGVLGGAGVLCLSLER